MQSDPEDFAATANGSLDVQAVRGPRARATRTGVLSLLTVRAPRFTLLRISFGE